MRRKVICYGLYSWISAPEFMLHRFYIVFLAVFLFGIKINVPGAFAVTTPDFPACNNPTGTIRAEHNDGVHGIVGNVSEYKGKDIVYNVNGDQVLQCLCTENGEGIQTNWWKASSLSAADVQILKSQGWYYVVDGALWGLENQPYMAKNNQYECREESGGIGGGEVLGLATTGDRALFYSFFGIGIGLIFLLLGFLLLRKGK